MNFLDWIVNFGTYSIQQVQNFFGFLNLSATDVIQIFILIVAVIAIGRPSKDARKAAAQEKEALKGALVQEILANMDSLFNGGIERPFLYINFEKFVNRLSSKIVDESEFQRIMSLYIDLKDYRAITNKFWPPSISGYKPEVVNPLCTNKQLKTINAFLQYFDEPLLGIDDEEKNMSKLTALRTRAQELRNNQQEQWDARLKDNIGKII